MLKAIERLEKCVAEFPGNSNAKKVQSNIEMLRSRL